MRERWDWFTIVCVSITGGALLLAFGYEIWRVVHCGCIQ